MSATRGAGRHHIPLRGILSMAAGVFCMSVVDAVSKALVGGYTLAQIMFFTRALSPFFAIALALAQGGILTLATRRMTCQPMRRVASVRMPPWASASAMAKKGLRARVKNMIWAKV